MKVIWTPEAQQDRTDVWDYILAENPLAAIHMDELFSDAAAMLVDYPNLGKLGKVQGTCELILHESYRLVYEIRDGLLWILIIVHTSKQWPPVQNKAE